MDKSQYRKSPLVLPKLKAKQELLEAHPSLRKYFPDVLAQQAIKGPQRPSRRHAPAAEDSDDEEKEAERLQNELKRIKKERVALLEALAAARAKSKEREVEGSVQSRDIAALRESLAEKQQAVNNLREQNAELEQSIEQLKLESRDCHLLIPEPGGGAAGDIADRLSAALAEHERATKEIETRTVQYQLLVDRTTRDRDEAERHMREARELKAAAEDDLHTLTQHYYELHAAKEAAERELGSTVARFDDARNEWKRKLRIRRREVKAMELRLAEEEAEAAQRAQQAADLAVKLEQQREEARAREHAAAAEANKPAVLAKLQAAEATWSRLKAIAGGANAPEDVVSAWKDLTGRAHALQDLLSLTCRREDRLRAELTALLKTASQEYNTIEKTEEYKSEIESLGSSRSEGGVAAQGKSALQVQQEKLHRLEALCAATELGLATLNQKLQDSLESSPDAWENARKLKEAQRAAQIQANRRRSSVAAARRRSSVAMPRRLSAVDLANARGVHQKRGSIVVIVDPEANARASVAEAHSNRASLHAAVGVDEAQHAQQHDEALFPELPILVRELSKRVDDMLALEQEEAQKVPNVEQAKAPAAAPVGEMPATISAAFPSDNSGGKNRKVSFKDPEVGSLVANTAVNVSAFAAQHGTPPSPALKTQALSGYKRSTMAGPAWVEEKNKSKTEIASPGASPTNANNIAAVLPPALQSSRSSQSVEPPVVEAADRYMKRLVGATVEPVAERDDPFALESSDEDDRPVLDRAAVKHRSHKITHPKPKTRHGSPGKKGGIGVRSPVVPATAGVGNRSPVHQGLKSI